MLLLGSGNLSLGTARSRLRVKDLKNLWERKENLRAFLYSNLEDGCRRFALVWDHVGISLTAQALSIPR